MGDAFGVPPWRSSVNCHTHLSMVDLPTFIAFAAWMMVWFLSRTNWAASSLN
jgi:hypothetical protein